MQRSKRHPNRFLILARRAREFARKDSGLVAELFEEHAAICESKAAAQRARQKLPKPAASRRSDCFLSPQGCATPATVVDATTD